jgi:hypothetical protein
MEITVSDDQPLEISAAARPNVFGHHADSGVALLLELRRCIVG